jgi:hypothetical protein
VTISSSSENSDRSFAVVTPSYLPDLERCELLVESLDRKAPDVPHYLIVDRRDRAAFRHLERGKRRLIESEALVGHWLWRTPSDKAFWLSFKALPVRGWIIQQILKIAALDAIPEHTLVFCDSDTAFFRRFDRDDLLVNNKIGLLDVDYSDDNMRRWTQTARRVLGAAQSDQGFRCHVGNMICWNRETVEALRQRIEQVTGTNWQVALARMGSFSEYMLYGVFVREVLGYPAVEHAPSDVPLVKPSWGVPLTTDAAIDAFFSEFDPQTVAVMIHSKDRTNLARIRYNLERLWNMPER